MSERLKEVLMKRDMMSEFEAEARINEARTVLYECLEVGDFFAAGEVCTEYFGLEPDYIFELL